MHLLGGDELRAAPADASILGLAGELPARSVELADAQRAPGDVREACRCRIWTWVEDRSEHRQLASGPAHQAGDEEPPAERECGHGHGPIGRVRDDAACALTRPLAAGLFLGR